MPGSIPAVNRAVFGVILNKKKVFVDLSSFGFIEKENNMFTLLCIYSTYIDTFS